MSDYRLTFFCDGKKEVAEGAFDEALLRVLPPRFKYRAVVTMEYDGKISSKMLIPRLAMRLKTRQVARDIFKKQLTYGLK